MAGFRALALGQLDAGQPSALNDNCARKPWILDGGGRVRWSLVNRNSRRASAASRGVFARNRGGESVCTKTRPKDGCNRRCCGLWLEVLFRNNLRRLVTENANKT